MAKDPLGSDAPGLRWRPVKVSKIKRTKATASWCHAQPKKLAFKQLHEHGRSHAPILEKRNLAVTLRRAREPGCRRRPKGIPVATVGFPNRRNADKVSLATGYGRSSAALASWHSISLIGGLKQNQCVVNSKHISATRNAIAVM